MGKKKKEEPVIAEKPVKAETEKKKPERKVDPKLARRSYTLKDGVTIAGVDYKKGDKVTLTDTGAKYFKKIKKI